MGVSTSQKNNREIGLCSSDVFAFDYQLKATSGSKLVNRGAPCGIRRIFIGYNAVKEKLRQHIEKRVPLTDEEFAFVLAHMREKKFRKHQFLLQEGEGVTYAYFVVSGLLKLTYTDESGKSHIVSFAMEDWWESDFNAFFSQTKATLSLDCLEDTAVFCFSLADFHSLCAGLPKFERFFVHLAIAGSVAAQQRILSLLTTNAQQRYEQLLKLYPTLIQRVSKTMLASYLGVSRETLSRFGS